MPGQVASDGGGRNGIGTCLSLNIAVFPVSIFPQRSLVITVNIKTNDRSSDDALSEMGNIKIFFFSFRSFFIHFSRRSTPKNNKFSKKKYVESAILND
jgi:hypothetical protein